MSLQKESLEMMCFEIGAIELNSTIDRRYDEEHFHGDE
jgi:hypothetical protein